MEKKITSTYNASGLVFGNLWGGGIGIYPSVKFTGFNNVEDLFKEIERRLKTGSLDSVMGYEKLLGAAMVIEEIRTIDNNGEIFQNSIFTDAFFGKMSKKEYNFLVEMFKS